MRVRVQVGNINTSPALHGLAGVEAAFAVLSDGGLVELAVLGVVRVVASRVVRVPAGEHEGLVVVAKPKGPVTVTLIPTGKLKESERDCGLQCSRDCSTGLQRYSVGDMTAKAATKMFIPAAAAGSHSSNAFLRCGEMAVSQVTGGRILLSIVSPWLLRSISIKHVVR